LFDSHCIPPEFELCGNYIPVTNGQHQEKYLFFVIGKNTLMPKETINARSNLFGRVRDQTFSGCPNSDLGSRRKIQFPEYIAHMSIHRPLAQNQGGSNLTV
jgi:hypothetical protein